MHNKTITPHKRVNITLPEKTLRLIDRLTKKGARSSFLDEAVHFYIKEISRAHLRDRLRRGALLQSSRDRSLAEDWFSIDEDVWRGEDNR